MTLPAQHVASTYVTFALIALVQPSASVILRCCPSAFRGMRDFASTTCCLNICHVCAHSTRAAFCFCYIALLFKCISLTRWHCMQAPCNSSALRPIAALCHGFQWMDIEKERGISISSTALTFPYNGYQMNLLDTPVRPIIIQFCQCMDPLLRHAHMRAPAVSLDFSISSCSLDFASLANLSAMFLLKSVVAVSRICTFGCYWTRPPEDSVCCWLTRVTRTSARTPTARWQRRTMQSCWSTAPRAWSRRRASCLRSSACGVCLPPDKTYMHE